MQIKNSDNCQRNSSNYWQNFVKRKGKTDKGCRFWV